eukprot:2032541-Pleurochrysis_carterae.AAC.3
MSLPSGVSKSPNDAAVHVATAQAKTEGRKAVVRIENERPPWSDDSACIIPAVTAAVTRMTFVIRDTMGQMPVASRTPEVGGAWVRSSSSFALDATG